MSPSPEQIEPEGIPVVESITDHATRGLVFLRDAVFAHYSDRLKQPHTVTSMIDQEGNKLLMTVDAGGNLHDEDGRIVGIHPDPEEAMIQIKYFEEDEKTNLKKEIIIGIFTIAALITAVRIAKLRKR
jgi:hypothetical protein